MVGAIRVVSVERGHDPRDFVLLPFGGAGPLHSGALGRLLGAKKTLVPPAPGVLSALGLLVSDLKADYVRTCLQLPPDYNYAEMEGVLAEMEAQATAWFEREGLPPAGRAVERMASMRYQGQGFELTVPWPGRVDAASTKAAIERFHTLHRQLYTFAQEDTPVEIVTLRVTAVGRLSQPELPTIAKTGGPEQAWIGQQSVAFAEGTRDCPVYDRAKLGSGAVLMGPAIVTQLDCTMVLLDGQRAEVDRYGSLIVEETRQGLTTPG